MGTHTNVIEINGTKYDAVTGVVVSSAASKPSMDGVVRRSKDTSKVRPAMHSVKKHHVEPQKSATLMRTAVKKPTSLHGSDVQKPKPAAAKVVAGKPVITPRTTAVPLHRQQRADTTQKSSQVNKFSNAIPVVATVMPLDVRPTPINDSTLDYSRPRSSHMKKADLLEKAMQAAQGHNEPAYQHKKKLHHRIAKKVGISGRAVAITSTVLAGLLIGGFYAYQNVPKLAMKVASSRAGIKANMPAYSPAGFSFNGPVQYSSGQVVVDYKSNIDDREYTLTQQNSAWSSDALLNNFLVTNGKQYQTYQDRGRTIYIYDNNNATWVDGGIWYQIEGKSQLSSDQLVRIASSL